MSVYLGTQLLSGIATNTVFNAHNLFDFKWTDHELTDQSWLKADTFSWQDGTAYSDAYNHLVDDYDNAPATPTLEFLPLAENTNLGSNNWRDIAYDGEKFVAISLAGKISTSTDGITWSAATTVSELSASSTWVGICYGNGMFVATSGDGYSSTSSDGTTWSQATFGATVEKPDFGKVVYGNGVFVTVGVINGSYVYTSEDGSTWDYEETIPLSGIVGISYNGTRFVVINTDGYISTSTNGSVWTTPSLVIELVYKASPDWINVCYNGSEFVAVSQDGYISTSEDGLTWTTAIQKSNLYLPGSGNVYGIEYDGTKFAVVTGYGYTSTSANISTETIGSYTISYILASDGHKITTDETTVANIFNESGVAWYYILDKANTRFKLPRSSHGNIVEKYKSGTEWYRVYSDGWCEQGGAFLAPGSASATTYDVIYLKPFSSTDYFVVSNYAETSNNQYGQCYNLTTTQCTVKCYGGNKNNWFACGYLSSSPSNDQYKHLYFYVGQFSQSATEQTAGLNASLFNEKLDLNLANLDSDGKNVLDGAYNVLNTEIVNGTSPNGSTDLEYTLNTLPNDGNYYECIVTGTATTDSTSGHQCWLAVYTSLWPSGSWVSVCRTQTRSSSAVNTSGTATIIVPPDRKLYIHRASSYYGSIGLWLSAYRRIGTNR